MSVIDSDNRILALFEGAGTVETPTPGAKAWLARDPARDGAPPVLIKRVTANVGKGRATGALSLQHASIVRTRRWLADGGSLYVIRDVVRGRNLRQTLGAVDATRTNAETVRRLLLPALDALAAAHAQGFPHGGLSPENILIAEDGSVLVSDFASIDPRDPRHLRIYGGALTASADVDAMAGIITAFLPTTGAFANAVIRGRVEGILTRCDTLAGLRETLNALERFAAAPAPRPGLARPATGEIPTTAAAPLAPFGPPPEPLLRRDAGKVEPSAGPAGRLLWDQDGPSPAIPPGGGGMVTIALTNDGAGPVIVRMIATQHAWLNVRPLDLPLTVPPGGAARISFVVSAARLSPGEYRSEVYLSANTADGIRGAAAAQGLAGGWFRHTAEIRIRVEGGLYRPNR